MYIGLAITYLAFGVIIALIMALGSSTSGEKIGYKEFSMWMFCWLPILLYRLFTQRRGR